MTRALFGLSLAFALACGASIEPGPVELAPIELAPTGPSVAVDPAADARLASVLAVYRAYEADRPPEISALPWTRDLIARVEADRSGGEIGQLGFDPVIDGQDFEVRRPTVSLDADGRVVARFENFGQPVEVRWLMVEERGAWLADDLIGAEWRLREILTGR